MNPASPSTLPLKDIHLPPAISAWPPAPGWWIASILLLVAISAICFFVIRHRRRTAYRRAAIAAAKHCGERFQQHQDRMQLAADCSELLRRVAVAAYGTTAAGVSGKHWLEFLDARIATKRSRHKASTPVFSRLDAALLQAPYRPNVDYDAQELQNALQHWIKHHKVFYKRS